MGGDGYYDRATGTIGYVGCKSGYRLVGTACVAIIRDAEIVIIILGVLVGVVVVVTLILGSVCLAHK